MGHASITTTLDLYGHLYPGEMDRYADRLDDAATASDAAKMRPDADEDEDQGGENDEDCASACDDVSALGGTRTPNLLTDP